MAKLLGIDYGTKRIGVAISDESLSVAFPKEIFDKGEEFAVSEIKKICAEENIKTVVIGLPRALKGMHDTDMTKRAREFGEKLGCLGVIVEFEDEFLSSAQAKNESPGKNGKLDASAAAIILQSYIERGKNVIE